MNAHTKHPSTTQIKIHISIHKNHQKQRSLHSSPRKIITQNLEKFENNKNWVLMKPERFLYLQVVASSSPKWRNFHGAMNRIYLPMLFVLWFGFGFERGKDVASSTIINGTYPIRTGHVTNWLEESKKQWEHGFDFDLKFVTWRNRLWGFAN